MKTGTKVIWQCPHDKNMFYIGVKSSTGFAMWFPIFCDGVTELFGEDFPIGKIGTEPVPIEINATVDIFKVSA